MNSRGICHMVNSLFELVDAEHFVLNAFIATKDA
jgi:hypothetical protein